VLQACSIIPGSAKAATGAISLSKEGRLPKARRLVRIPAQMVTEINEHANNDDDDM